MAYFDIQVCLISGQAAPNLLPILDPQFKPKEAIFLVSPQMKNQANYLEKVFKDKGVRVQQEHIPDIFNFGEMSDYLLSLLEKYEDSNISIGLNVTGGTKLLAIAAQKAFELIGKPVFYMDTDENRIIFISKNNENKWISDFSINAKNDLNDYLASYGAKILNKGEVQLNKIQQEIVNELIIRYDDYKNEIPLLNKSATLSQQTGYKFKESKDIKIQYFINIINKFNDVGLIKLKDDTIDFIGKNYRDLVSGGWLEEYTLKQVKQIAKVQDYALSCEVANNKYRLDKNAYSNENKGNMNEFDVLFLAKNKLHIIECKTQLLDKGNSVKAEDILYKLETLKDYGGLMTKKCLVSYFPVPDATKNRAKTYNITIIDGKDVQRLKQKLQEWIG
ncbi:MULTISPECIES: Card1-like endonuclease domain-containing protein [Rodentibacter]|uniref:Card1-like endonuclease domain-containing protein n=1 Tax=Rodentibacter TaxID=1960084 RepID=UPI001CFE969A|nr:DUF1887 family CARF protein [Rodentibacter sp. JRC1]GJI56763.1 hypothetical protein HEMROJRC1_18750 [Rodentibacter sp. JRC1]